MQSRVDRAKQFLPFEALNGFRNYLNNAATVASINLSGL